mmetsp:Transcript_19430/g.57326  ORF Transcript_19430/g.57326 Transcript_19430/m.57326 type:complete len:383 (-) Transcript_19430:210-1358(-)
MGVLVRLGGARAALRKPWAAVLARVLEASKVPIMRRSVSRTLSPRRAAVVRPGEDSNVSVSGRADAHRFIPRAAVGEGPLQEFEVTAFGRSGGGLRVPGHTVAAEADEGFEVARGGRSLAGALVEGGAALPESPREDSDVAAQRRFAHRLTVPVRAVLPSPSQDGQVSTLGGVARHATVPRAVQVTSPLQHLEVTRLGRRCTARLVHWRARPPEPVENLHVAGLSGGREDTWICGGAECTKAPVDDARSPGARGSRHGLVVPRCTRGRGPLENVEVALASRAQAHSGVPGALHPAQLAKDVYFARCGCCGARAGVPRETCFASGVQDGDACVPGGERADACRGRQAGGESPSQTLGGCDCRELARAKSGRGCRLATLDVRTR